MRTVLLAWMILMWQAYEVALGAGDEPRTAAVTNPGAADSEFGELIFDGGLDVKNYSIQVGNRDEGLAVVTMDDGTKAFRVVTQKDDPIAAKKIRSELVPKIHRAVFGETYWYMVDILVPNEKIDTKQSHILLQWHGVPDRMDGKLLEPFRNAPMKLRVIGSNISADVLYLRPNDKITKRPYRKVTKNLWRGPHTKEEWVQWRFRIKWSWESDGFIEMYRNGERVGDYTGPNAFHDDVGPYMKFGLYNYAWTAPWAKDRPAETERHTAYYKNVRIYRE